jgi:hypothetical protein
MIPIAFCPRESEGDAAAYLVLTTNQLGTLAQAAEVPELLVSLLIHFTSIVPLHNPWLSPGPEL